MKTAAVVILVAASALLFIQPVFAQADHDSPSEIGSGAWGSTDPVDSDNVPPPSASYSASHHLFDDLSPTYPSTYSSFAQSDHDSPSEIGSGAWGSTDPVDSDEPNAPSPYALPSYDEPFATGPALAPGARTAGRVRFGVDVRAASARRPDRAVWASPDFPDQPGAETARLDRQTCRLVRIRRQNSLNS